MSKVIALPGAAKRPVKQLVFHEDKRRTTDRPPNTTADGYKRFRMKIGTSPDGKPVMKNFTGRTRAEALKRKSEYLQAQKEGGIAPVKVNPVLDPAQPVSRWADRWYLIYYKGSERSEMSTKSIVKKIKESELGIMAIGDVVQINIQKFANEHKHSESYVTKIKHVVNKIFETAVANKIISASPCIGVTWEDNGTAERRPLQQYEIDLIRDNWHVHAAGVGAMLMLYTGARPDEARAQNWDNVTTENVLIRDSSYFNRSDKMVLKIGETKTVAGQRDVPIVAPLKAVFDQLERKDGALVWQCNTDDRQTGKIYRNHWRSFIFALRCIHLGIKVNKAGNHRGLRVDKLKAEDRAVWDATLNITPYSLRHTYCTMLYDADVDVKTMQYLMGHNDLETTLKIYAALTDAKKNRSYDKLKAFFSDIREDDD